MNKVLKSSFAALLSVSLLACGSGTSSNTSKQETTTQDAQPVEFEAMTVADNEECSFVISDVEEDGIGGYAVTVDLENKSADKTYLFALRSSAYNGVSIDSYWTSPIEPGKKSSETISFFPLAHELDKIGDVTDIELNFFVHDYESWDVEDIVNEVVHVYPLGEAKATKYVRQAEATDIVLVDNDKVKVTYIGVDSSDKLGYAMNLYVENKVDSMTMFTINQATINGVIADPYWATSVAAGNSAYVNVVWLTDVMKENGIENVEEIEIVLESYDFDDMNAPSYVEETFTIKP